MAGSTHRATTSRASGNDWNANAAAAMSSASETHARRRLSGPSSSIQIAMAAGSQTRPAIQT